MSFSLGSGAGMQRREFIGLVGGTAAWPLAANAHQKGKLPFIGVLNPGSTDTPGTDGFYDGLRENRQCEMKRFLRSFDSSGSSRRDILISRAHFWWA
jgi:hypothetical protein